MVLVILAFILSLVVGIPIAFVLGMTGIAHLVVINYPDIANIVPQRMFYGINVFSYMCIPFFIAAGQIMNKGGITQKIVDVSQEFVGFKRGGLAYTVVLVGMVLAAILGSANAVSVILCTIMIPAMVSSGYDEEFAGSLVASSGILGCIIPPSVDFVIYAVLAGVSVQKLFVGGILPGICLGFGFMAVIAITTKKKKYPKYKEHFEPGPAFKTLFTSLPALCVPVIIVGGVLAGVFTPTESGAVACVVATILGFAYRNLKIKDLPGIFASAALITAGIMLIISFGNVIGWTLAFDKVPEKLVQAITSTTTNPSLVMALVLGMLFLIGMVMEAFAAMIILVPVLYPLGEAMGYDPIHFGMIIIIMLTIALATPPVGMLLFTTSKVSGIHLNKLNKSIWPFVAAGMVVTIILAYVPQITTFLPNLLYGK
ncbi:TRAP transporter large permease [Sinanaerobacter chloroacetimidivorans]|jgi:tripartite ATP-independent transporter DctM subunit|uniref:TRAP transporter large permease n=1 Tax=Sinanaerobacter chloroacetimidivorans TaxID=2818044 RepID=A0A8J7W2E6_9FIRM|nr:TRAP transporter large permease [Sinanaerobacter chloroacetimidivorans]MBR0598020.1 TRAP transporter large permease [Sinanaerobacter chloroacetimidivorans]